MELYNSHICCAPLAEALRRAAAEHSGETFLVVEGEGGALFCKVGHAFGGQFTSAFTERLSFCPFCGRGVGGSERAPSAGASAEPEDEVTRWQLGETQEVETVLAALAARGAGHAIHVSDF
jgi:hypothetical protein